MELGLGLIVSSFIAGVFTFFAPCTLPLIPAFLGVISGVGQDQLTDPEAVKELRWKIFSNAVFYVLGFSLVFILFGVAFSALGQILVIRVFLQRIGGVLIIFFGLFLLGILKIKFLNAEHQIRSPKLFKNASKVNAFGVGALFALGWSPCVGPLLGTILLFASSSATLGSGILLLVTFSVGLAIPFLLTALLIGRAFSAFSRWNKALKVINIIAGIFLIALGTLLLIDQFDSVFGLFRQYFLKLNFYEEFILKYL